MKKRILSILLSALLIVSLLPMTAMANTPAQNPTDDHSHDGVTFTAWTDALATSQYGSDSNKTAANSLPKDPGNYYLTEDVTLGASWNVPTGTTNLDLNGHVIKANCTADNKFSVITVGKEAALNLYDCGTTEHYFTVGDNGLWTLTDAKTETTKTVTGGCITGGNGSQAGGVYVEQGNPAGKLTMKGGNIVGNTSSNAGGGVYLQEGATFDMDGGSVVGNKAKGTGGGVGISKSAPFTMTGGKIEYNVSESSGGGVYYNNGTITLGGTAKITGNFNGTGETKTANNLYLNTEKLVEISSTTPPALGMSVGVTVTTPPTDGSPKAFTSNGTADDAQYFFSDNPSYHVGYGDNVLKLVSGSSWSLLNNALNMTDPTSVTSVDGVFRVNSTGEGLCDITLLSDITAADGDQTLNILKGKSVTIRLDGHKIDRNLSAPIETGSAITVNDNAILSVLGPGTITGGKTTGNGGGINNSGTLTLYGGTIDGNTATGNGGGIYNNGTLTLGLYAETTLSNNYAAADGGGIYSSGGSLKLSSTTISHNNADANGGGIYAANYVEFGSTSFVSSVTYCNAGNGGGVYVAKNGWVEDCGGKITNNTATDKGGGVYVEHGGTATFGSSATVSVNTAGIGGGIYSKGAVGLEDVTISENTAVNGGGVYISGGEAEADKGSIFLGKTAKVINNNNNNLYLCDNILLAKFGTGEDVPAPQNGMSIGVTTATKPTADNPVPITSNDAEDYSQFLDSDNSDYKVAFATDHLELQVKPAPPAPTSGGDYTPTVTVPVSGDSNSVKVQATVSGKTAIVEDIKAKDLAKVSGAESVTIDLSAVGKNVSTAKIPTATVEKIAEGNAMSVKLPVATVEFNKAATQEIADQAKGSNIELVVDDIKEVSLNAVQKESVKKLDTAVIIDAYLVSGGGRLCTADKGGFGGGKAKVVLPYEIKNNRAPENYNVFYVDDAGKLEKLNAIYDKELKAFVFEITHFSVYAVAYDEYVNPFTDVAETAYYYDAVKWAAANGITSGKTSETLFAPNDTCTRAEFVTFLWRAAGKPVVNYMMPFTDVPAGKYYTEAVRWAASEGIVKGLTDTTFSPNALVNRGQAVAFLYRYSKAPALLNMTANGPAPSPFSDVANTSYCYQAVLWAVKQGITEGVTETTFAPGANCPRSQVVTFLYRYFVK